MHSLTKSLNKPIQATLITGTIPSWLSGTLYRYVEKVNNKKKLSKK